MRDLLVGFMRSFLFIFIENLIKQQSDIDQIYILYNTVKFQTPAMK